MSIKEEKAKEFINKFTFGKSTYDAGLKSGLQTGYDNGYFHGYNQSNIEWREKVQWIPASEKLPEDVLSIEEMSKDYLITECVEVKGYYMFDRLHEMFNKISRRSKCYYDGKTEWRWVIDNTFIITHWRRIIE